MRRKDERKWNTVFNQKKVKKEIATLQAGGKFQITGNKI